MLRVGQHADDPVPLLHAEAPEAGGEAGDPVDQVSVLDPHLPAVFAERDHRRVRRVPRLGQGVLGVVEAGLRIPDRARHAAVGEGRTVTSLADDPGETKDQATEKPGLVRELATLMGEVINNGRSTPGAPQRNDVEVKLPLVDGVRR